MKTLKRASKLAFYFILLSLLSIAGNDLIKPYLAWAACSATTNFAFCRHTDSTVFRATDINGAWDLIDDHDHTGATQGALVPMTTGISASCTDSQVVGGNAAGTRLECQAGGLVTGMVFFTTAATCPSGSAEYTTARGFYIVGLPSGGTSATSVGTALTNLENRAAGQHLHSVDPPSTSVAVTDPGHVHTYNLNNTGSTGDAIPYGAPSANLQQRSVNSATTGITASVDIAAFDSANGGTTVGTNAPYIHLLVCRQS